MRKRPESEGRLLARTIPDGARVVGLVYVPEEGSRGLRTAEAVATAVGRRREHTLLAPLGPAPESLRASLGGGARGLHDALEGRAGLKEVARRPGTRPFVYLPAGEEAPEPAAMLESPAFRDFAARVRRRGGTLLLLIPASALEAAAATGLLDGYVSLGDAVPDTVEAVREFGRVSPPAQDAASGEVAGPERAGEVAGRRPAGPAVPAAARTAPEPDVARPAAPEPSEPAGDPRQDREDEGAVAGAGGAEERPERPGPGSRPRSREGAGSGGPDGGRTSADAPAGREEAAPRAWRRHRAASRAPILRVAIGLLVVLVLAGGWWLLARESVPAGPASRPSAGVASPTAADGAAAAEAPDPEVLRAAVEGAPELPYSVLIASYASRSDAEERLDELEGRGDGLFFAAPTPVRGAVYWRVFAGARAGAAAGRELMEDLVESGLKDEVGSWHVRPVRLAYRLGVHPRREAAERAAASARDAGIPAYVIMAAAAGDTAWTLYAGAYESESAAAPMERMLERAGREVALAPRRGTEP